MAAVVDTDTRLARYADLAVRVGANLQPGQTLFVASQIEHAPLARAITRAGYQAGARYVDVNYRDEHVRRAMISLGPDEALTLTPAWMKTRAEALADNALIATTGDPEPDLLSDLDGERVGRARMLEIAEIGRRRMVERSTNWSGVAFPNEGWATQIFGEPDVERLWELVAFCTRLDEDDPVAAWRSHMQRLEARASKLNELDFDALHYSGPGTDFTVGLLAEAHGLSALFRTRDGVEYVPNMPTEEVFTTPDPARTSGTVRSTRPLALLGQIVRGLEVRFDDGRIVDVQAESGADIVRAQVEMDDGAHRLGEVALVDGSSRVGRTGITFFDTLFDENATCHVAFGSAYAEALEDGIEPNESNTHVDFMIGGPDVDVDGVTKEGQVVPLLRDDVWQVQG